MKKLILSFLAMYFFCNVFAQVQIAVMDAVGDASVNGVYAENGSYNGKPRYVKGNIGIYYKNCYTKWAINDTNSFGGGNCPPYSTYEDIAGDIPPFHTWHRYSRNSAANERIQLGLPGSLILSHDYIGESINDDGSMNNHTAIIIRYFFPQGNTFTGSAGDNFVTAAKVNVYNVPAGLTPVVTKLSDTTLHMTLTGNATSHTASDDIDSVRIEFLDAAFSHNDTNLVANPNITGIRVVFDREYYYVSNASTFPNINGWFMEDGTYNSHPRYRNGYYFMGYRGCNSAWVINQSSDALQGIGRCPMYSNTSTDYYPPSSNWHYRRYENPVEPISVYKPNSLNYSKDRFNEILANDGSINNSDTLVIQLCYPDGFTFTGNNGENFVTASKVNIYNLPAGLTAVVTRMNDTTLYATLEGNASSHSSSNNVDNLTLEFLNSAFTNNDTSVISYYIKSDFKIVFDPIYMYVENAVEYPAVNGFYLEADDYNGKKMYKKDGSYYLGYRSCNTRWVINDGDENSIGNGCPIYSTMADNDTIPPDDGWKYEGRSGNNSNILITPVNSIYYNRKVFIESDDNNGSFQDTISVRYVYPMGGLLTGSNGENFVANGKVIVNNLPAGLSMGIYRTSDTTLIAVIGGTATIHDNVPDILNLTITFQNTAFTHGIAGIVIFSSMPDLSILFLEKVVVENATSTASVNGIYKKTGYINGRRLYAKGVYRLGYRDCSTRWVIRGYDNDYTVLRGLCPLYLTSIDGLLPYNNEGWSAIGDQSEIINVFPVNSIQYSTIDLKENTIYNDGSISKEDTMALVYRYPFNNATFTGVNGDDFVAQNKATIMNLPAGLSMKLVRTNDTTLIAEFSGKALLEDDVTNFTITLQNTAFTHNDTSTVINYHRDDITINFVNIYSVASTGGDFNTLPSAVNSPIVEDGDHLVLAPETFTVNNLTLNKDLVIRGQGPGQTIIQGAATPGTGNSRIFYINYASVTIENMTIRNATYSGSYGGAIHNYYSTLSLKSCELYDNENSYTDARGGAVCSRYGILFVENCTFYNNRASGTNTSSTYGGGAICIYHSNSNNKARIINSTFYNNYSHNNGGAILIYGNTDIINTTIAGDTAVNNGGGIYFYSYTTNCLNTLIADNTSLIGSGPDYYGYVTANYSIIENTTNTYLNGSNNIIETDPQLSPLADNGGLTKTCAIPVTSVAVNAGIDTALAPYDQRMAVRPDTTDIGAYEYNAVIPTITTSTTIGGSFITSASRPLALDVPYTVTGTFESNKFYAYLSGPDTNWAGERAVGELVSNTSGTIQTTIDTTGLPAGPSICKIRVKSTNPAITGTESNTFIIIVADQYIYPAANQVVNVSENGDTLRVFEKPKADSRIWKYGTTSGVYPNDCGSTDTLYVPSFGTAGTYYVVCVSTYGTAQIASNEVIIEVVEPTIIINSINTPPFRITNVISDNGTVDFTAIGRYNSNTFSAYLSDRFGSFGAEIFIGSVVSDTNNTINITINTGTQPGTGYKIRLKSTNPAVTGPESDSFAIIYDTVPPTPVLSSTSSSSVNGTISMDIDFGEPVFGLTINEITLDNCTASDLSSSDSILYTVDLTPETPGVFTAQVNSGVALDKVGLANLESNLFSRIYDNTKPSVTIVCSEADTTILRPFSVEIRFNEAVTGFDIGDIDVSNATVDNFAVTQTNRRWSVDVYGTNKGIINIDIRSGAATDIAGNSNTAAKRFSIYYDGLVGVDEVAMEKTIQVFPNPTDGTLYINSDGSHSIKVILTDITGKMVMNKLFYSAKNEIDLSNYAKGIYFMQLSYRDRVDNVKIILK